MAGGGVATLRFILQSVHADVRREVLTEVTAQVGESWGWPLLLEFYNDADPSLRQEAFAFAVRKSKALAPLESALQAQYLDVRRLGVDGLIKKHTAAAQALLVKALGDADRGVRQLALEALVGEDAQGPLTQALVNEHPDVRVRAARALARHGASSALAPLLALATAPEPKERERVADWLALAESALEGLAELGDQAALVPLVPLLESEHPSIRKLAARALAWVALPHHRETLQQALQHSDPQVKYHAALGLAYSGDPLVSSLVFSEPAGQVLSRDEQLVGAFNLGSAGEDQFAVFLDDANENVRRRALLLLMLLELKAPQGAPTRCLTCLSARPPGVRLTAARALERFADPNSFRDFVVELFNDRGTDQAWKVPAETVEALAELLAHGSPAARARSALLLRLRDEKEPAAWEQGWALHADRFAQEIRSLKAAAGERQPVAPQYTPEQLQELAFGAYVGLVREQGGTTGPATEAEVVRARQSALTRIRTLATAGGKQGAARPVLVQALGDPHQAVRMQAFDQLAALGVDADTLGAAALGAGHVDIGVRGLELLAGGGNTPEGQIVNDPGHVLQDAAAEALGHLGRSAKADEVFALLSGLARGQTSLAESALRGLRWLDHPEGWQLIRRRAADSSWYSQYAAVELLGYDDEPGSRELILRLLAESEDWDVSQAALEAARRLWGKDSVEPDYAVVQNQEADEGQREESFKRLQERGDVKRLLEILPKLDEETAERLKGILINRRPVPVEEAKAVLGGPDPLPAGVAAHILGRAGKETPGAAQAVAASLKGWWEEWDRGRQEEARRGGGAGTRVGSLLNPLRGLIWAAGRLGGATDTLISIATTRVDVPHNRPLRREAVVALAAGELTEPVVAALKELAGGSEPEVRTVAAEAVARAGGAQAKEVAGKVLSDRVTFNRVAARAEEAVTDTLRTASAQVHYQGVAVPLLAARGDIAGLASVAENAALPEETRLGAVEGLAAAAREDAEEELVKIGKAEGQPEGLRKAAWRGRRRSKRARLRAVRAAAGAVGVVGAAAKEEAK